MAKSRSKTRRRPHANPRGILTVAPDGFGFVQTAEGSFFIPSAKMGGAFDGDMVEIAVGHVNYERPQAGKQHNRPGQKPTARVVSVVQRAHETVIGRYEVADPFGVVVPQDHRIPYDIFTMRADHPEIADGSIVRVRITEFPSRNTAATGIIEDVLGTSDDVGVDIESIIGRYQLETKFSDATMRQVTGTRVDVAGALASGYRDLRGRFIFTVDPQDARDFDDALSLEQMESGLWKLGVHIADVSHYVPWNSSVDLDARRRAMSVYLVDRVIPMLPEKLSGDLCSLVPHVARRAMTVDIVLDESVVVKSVDCYPSIIESKARLSYERAECYLDAVFAGDDWHHAAIEADRLPEPAGAVAIGDAAHQQLFAALGQLVHIARGRAAQRQVAGGVDFETTEAKVQLDDAGEPTEVLLRRKTPATSCIEEAMILANECVARRLRDSQTPAIYRVHERPSADSLAALLPVLQEFGYTKGIDVDAFVAGNPHALQEVLRRAHGKTESELISSLLLRSMQRAVYRPVCMGHYGLASDAYCHFTSPIRRYPDLVVHRMLKVNLFGRGETYQQQCDNLEWLAEHSSKMERIAEAAARESQEIKLVEYMRRFVGMTFSGIVAGVATYGVFVRLENTVEGLVPVRSLGNEYFSLDPTLHKLTGQDSGVAYRLGQHVDATVVAAPDHARRLDLRLASPVSHA